MLQIFIIITNGESSDTTQTANIAEFARSRSWKVIGVFVGASSQAGYREMLQISTVRQNVEQLRVNTFADLQAKFTVLEQAANVTVVPSYGHSSLYVYSL